jgi:23S rRNA (guanosine2251-2'-O)-methyltransferase
VSEWVFGFHAVLAALQHEPARVEVVCVAEGAGGKRANEVLALARAQGVRFSSLPRRELDRLAAGAAHNGFAARLAPAPLAAVEELLAQQAPVCLLGLDGVQDPRNLGAVIRVAAAFGLGGVVLAGPHPPPLGGAAAKVAAGTLPLVPVARVGSLGDLARRAQEQGFVVLGADAQGEAITAVEWPDRLLLCVGGEEGLRAKTTRFLDGRVAIPMDPRVESLNLAVACGILAWEWRRRWPWGRGGGRPQTP